MGEGEGCGYEAGDAQTGGRSNVTAVQGRARHASSSSLPGLSLDRALRGRLPEGATSCSCVRHEVGERRGGSREEGTPGSGAYAVQFRVARRRNGGIC